MSGVVRFPTEIADLITSESWTVGWGDVHGDGPTCLHGHVRRCDLRPGDAHLISAVFASGPGSMDWNDEQSDATVVARWARSAEVTDDMLAATFGPQWRELVALVRRVASMTSEEATALGAAWDAAWDAARGAALDAALGAAWWGAALDAARGAALDAALGAALGAALALAVADLAGQHGLQRHHIDTLLGPVREVIGDPLDPETVEAWLKIGETA